MGDMKGGHHRIYITEMKMAHQRKCIMDMIRGAHHRLGMLKMKRTHQKKGIMDMKVAQHRIRKRVNLMKENRENQYQITKNGKDLILTNIILTHTLKQEE